MEQVVESAVESEVGVASRLLSYLPMVLVASGLAVFDPFGWDSFGPIRWFIIPAIGFAFIALSLQQPPHGSLVRWSDHSHTADPARSVEPILFVALLCWGFLASVLAVDRVHAWIGTPDRRFGWLAWLLCGGLFLVSRQLDEVGREKVVRGFAVGAVGLGAYTLLEWLGSVAGSGPVWPTIDVSFAGGRVGGPFGQPAHAGAAAVLAAPISAALAADPTASTRWRVVGGLGAALCGLAVLTSQSRAAWLGAIVAVALLIIAAPRIRKLVIVPAVMSIVIVAAVPALRGRITGAFGDGGVVAGRTDEWQVGVRALADAPLFGYGPEGYRTVFGAHVDQEYVVAWGRDVITDRAHSGVLDVALIFGIPGAVLYLALAVLVLRAAWRAVSAGETTVGLGPGVDVGVGVGVTAYLVQQQLLFPLSEIDPLFWMAAGLLLPVPQPLPATKALPVAQSVAGGVAIGLAIAWTVVGFADVIANVRLSQVLGEDGGGTQTVDAIEGVSAIRPDSIRYRFIGSRIAGQQGDLQQALEQIESGLDISPNDPALRGEEARLALEIARASPPGTEQAAAITGARATLEALILIEPNHPEHLLRLGIARALDDDLEEAISATERAVLLAPDQPEPKRNLEELLRLQDEN